MKHLKARRHRWSIREVHRLWKRRCAGERTINLADEIGVSPGAIRQAFMERGYTVGSPIPPAGQLAILYKRYQEGERLRDLAEDLDLSYLQLYDALKRAGHITRINREWSDEECEGALDAYLAGVSCREIGEQLGCHRTTVYHLLDRAEGRERKRNVTWTDARLFRLRGLVADGVGFDEIADIFGCSVGALKSTCTRYSVRRGRHRWTPEAVRRVQIRIKNGETWRQVAGDLGMQEDSLRTAMKRKGALLCTSK